MRDERLIFNGRLTRGTGISVDNIEAACKRFEEKGVTWKKKLTDGRMKNIAFILDPDGYWIEVVENERLSGKQNF